MNQVSLDASSLQARLIALEEKHAEQARLIAELRNEGALKTQFLSNISHDLRTPLTAIITHAEILRDGILGELNERQCESLTGIIAGGRQLLEMVGEILTYARAAADQVALTCSEFTIESIIEQVRAVSEPLAARKSHVLTMDVEPALPPLWADREKIAHVMANLLSNAIHFTPPGGRVWITARSAAGERGPAILVEVGDTGIGIAPEHHELIFREFAQVDSTASRQHHGTGLGLAIARKFVELHEGRIWLESIVGEGSRFYFTVPIRAPEPGAPDAP
ncbi:MAG TPA: HAMP domain-containing sensor histidine kinase [Gemmatimonadaceae bacterium]|nr:HAMP domain-containing sensor histidine kinase [Gemmatimonadaceae bacterium]